MTRDQAKAILENLDLIRHFADGGDVGVRINNKIFPAKNINLCNLYPGRPTSLVALNSSADYLHATRGRRRKSPSSWLAFDRAAWWWQLERSKQAENRHSRDYAGAKTIMGSAMTNPNQPGTVVQY